jgi:hypothetical protein
MVNAVLRDIQRLPESTTSENGYVGLAREVPNNNRSSDSVANNDRSTNYDLGGRGAVRRTIYGPAGRIHTTGGGVNNTYYCFAHGTNRTHSGVHCDLMARDKRYTLMMQQATGPCTIDGFQGAPVSSSSTY